MKEPQMFMDLLNEASERPDGSLLCVRTFGMSAEKQNRRHHVELLVDAGHMTWVTGKKDMVRITNAGYDFLNACESNADAKATFVEKVKAGFPYVDAALKAVEVALKIGGA